MGSVSLRRGKKRLEEVRRGSYELFANFTLTVTNIYAKNKNDMNCLYFAVIHGHLNLCKALIDEYQFDITLAIIADGQLFIILHELVVRN